MILRSQLMVITLFKVTGRERLDELFDMPGKIFDSKIIVPET